jgi:hypothetical protein
MVKSGLGWTRNLPLGENQPVGRRELRLGVADLCWLLKPPVDQ